jgi:hypothetical protein
MKALKLFSYFLSGASITTLLGWGISFTPFGLRVGVYALVFSLVTIVAALTFDDPISEFFDLQLSSYYTVVFGVAITLIAGCAVLGALLWL